MLTADDSGVVKYWQTSMNNSKAFKAHKEAVRDVSFCPSDAKFATASDDQTVSVWDFDRAAEEQSLKGHGWDVKSVSWHPYKGLIATGSKDNLVKLWVCTNHSLAPHHRSSQSTHTHLFASILTGSEIRHVFIDPARPQKYGLESGLESKRSLVCERIA